MSRDNIMILAGNEQINAAVGDLLSATHHVETILVGQNETSYNFSPVQIDKIRSSKIIIVNIPSIANYSPLLLSYLKTLNKTVHVILLHNYTQKAYAHAFIKMGASAYLPVNFHQEVLLEAIERVMEGERFIGV